MTVDPSTMGQEGLNLWKGLHVGRDTWQIRGGGLHCFAEGKPQIESLCRTGHMMRFQEIKNEITPLSQSTDTPGS